MKNLCAAALFNIFGHPEASLRSLPARVYRSPDEQVRRLAAARRKRTRKCEARLWWQACGGERTLAERAAAG
jgi:hypothetical protein